MIALLASYFVVAYLLVPRAIFRLSSVFIPLKRFQRTRTEEITFAVLVALLPFVLASALPLGGLAAWVLSWVCESPTRGTWADYKAVFTASYSVEAFTNDQNQFWSSASQAACGQLNFLLRYYIFCLVQAAGFILVVRQYARWRKCPPFRWFAEHILLRNVSEWHMLLTTVNFPDGRHRRVAVDVLTVEDHLYQGFVDEGGYFVDVNGDLSGLLLTKAKRFDRPGYLAARSANASTTPDAFWKAVPGSTVHIPSGNIVSMNLRYPPTGTAQVPARGAQVAAAQAAARLPAGLRVEVA